MDTQRGTTSAEGESILRQAEWAVSAFADFDQLRVNRILTAVAEVAHRESHRFAEMSVQETGFGVVEDKTLKNQAMALRFLAGHAEVDYCSHRVIAAEKTIEIPRPAGVILALIPSTSPVSTLYFTILSALMTRNAVVVSPHPAAAQTCAEVVDLLEGIARAAGSPAGAIQVLDLPEIAVVQGMMTSSRTKLVLAIGGAAIVKAAYESGTPAIGVGRGNPPLLVDETANLDRAARDIIRSKSFDNSLLPAAESVLFAVESIAVGLINRLAGSGAHVCSETEVDQVRTFVYPDGSLNSKAVGLSAIDLAHQAGFTVEADTKVLITPISHTIGEESLTHEKLCPVLAYRVVPTVERGIAEAKALLRIAGAGHSAVIHSQRPQSVLDFGTALSSHRITVNAPGSLGPAGLGAESSVAAGFVGGSAIAGNLRPDHLVQWSRVAYPADLAVPFPDFTGIRPPRVAFPAGGAVPPLPLPSNADGTAERVRPRSGVLEPVAPNDGPMEVSTAQPRGAAREEQAIEGRR